MKYMKKILTPVCMCCMLGASGEEAAPGILQRDMDHNSMWADFPGMVLGNPALNGFRYSTSLGKIEAGFSRDIMKRGFHPREGRGYGEGYFSSGAFYPLASSAVWGSAGYDNGKIFDMQWNETAEYDLNFPYTIADAKGGDMKSEHYSFTGGYSGRSSRLIWGCEGGYRAGLYYRQTDPRPKNTSGRLCLKGGFGVTFRGGEMLAISLDFSRYRMSTDVEFVSETGEIPLYHVTGLASHYIRFAGNGSRVSNTAYNYGASIDFMQSSRNGWFASGAIHRQSLKHLIVDLNKLPMARTTHLSGSVEAGYRSADNPLRWGVRGCWEGSRLHGLERIFGDAGSGQYPVIGESLMAADNRMRMMVTGFCGHSAETSRYSAEASAEYTSRHYSYRSPGQNMRIGNCGAALRLNGYWILSRKFSVSAMIIGEGRWNLSRSLSLTPAGGDEASVALTEATVTDFKSDTARAFRLAITPSAAWAFKRSMALTLAPGMALTHLTDCGNEQLWSIAAALIF